MDHNHSWTAIPGLEDFPQRLCRCGIMKMGTGTVLIGDSIRFAKTKIPTSQGEIGMDVAKGDIKSFQAGAAREIAVVDDIISSFPASPATALLTLNGGQTRYLSYAGDFAAESEAEIQIGKSAIKCLTIKVQSNGLSGVSTFTLRKNGVNTPITFAVSAGATGFFRNGGLVKYAEADRFSVQAVLGGTALESLAVRNGTVGIAPGT